MTRTRHTLGPLIAYHGCDRRIAEAVLAGKAELHPSINEYDWLGSGAYFWMDSPERGLDWARGLTKRAASDIEDPYVIGALIYPGLCLNLTDYGTMHELRRAFQALESRVAAVGLSMPKNTTPVDGIFLRRALDCAVINFMHHIRVKTNEPFYDTVFGVFEEGGEVYPGAGFKAKTHIQIAVRNPDCIVGYFRVREV